MEKEKKCYFCGIEVTEDGFCFGCKHYICMNCDETEPSGKHRIEDHREE